MDGLSIDFLVEMFFCLKGDSVFVSLKSVHLQQIFHFGSKIPIKWNTYSAVNIYFSNLFMSYLVGFMCTLLFQSPFVILQKLIFEETGERTVTPGRTNKLYPNNVSDKISIKLGIHLV